MAEKRPLPVPEVVPEARSSSPESKRTKKQGEAEEESSSGERSLESSEKLAGAESSRREGRAESKDEDEPSLGSGSRGAGEPAEQDLETRTRDLSRFVMGQSGESSRTQSGSSSHVGEHAHYEEISVIGDGAYGTVYKAKDLTSGQVVALKKVRVPLTEDGLPTSTLREIAGLKQLERFEHPHIVRLLDVCQGSYLQLPSGDGRTERIDRGLTLWLVFEHVERDLASYIASCSNRQSIPSDLVRQMSREILLGVDFLHSHRIVHRDLKPQNLLVTSEGRIKIADFGLAKTYDFEMRLTSVVVTLWYRAPEVLLGCPYATPVDLWSVGCILAEINRLQPLFPGTSEGDQLDKIFQLIGTPSHDSWPENVSLSWTAFPHRQAKPLRSVIPSLEDEGLDLIQNLLTFDPHVRLTAAQALLHQYFSGMAS
ncbi:cyclin-dependent kinase 4 [Venturia canescens]|uniref:cyclin-dependent kinase 4 n=1 Tax=Venturia canescens TaxID=32260 RepID=UPI001C9D183F|nr:cyclin-dependent kinase 4 [Venturia canescens]XP_043288784.1 cyclin-dependent kinase 4 [Venturia canescens]XP_043288785.1 cyclin-dependent kinase 4 [Venturia canescens]XP_043288787.1 cyclin-dependent kinase 4 [Venturia canescens]XP_043288788.1 cyclin-dependent kinase 4 [Venturia canescens]XP_043288789.1 cyclin-dependent kinase 4 [Venturia canescens]